MSKQTIETTVSSRNYVVGFLGSLVLTIIAFVLVQHHMFSKWILVWMVAILAGSQFILQLIYFMHLGREPKPRWKLAVFIFMLGVVIIVVAGSLWIMTNLNYRMLNSPQQINRYIQSQDGL